VVLADLVNCQDIWVIERDYRVRFLLKPLQALRITPVPRAPEKSRNAFTVVFYTALRIFAAKLRNSARRAANMGLPKYLPSAWLRNRVKIYAIH
jgi:hypothetical protein